MMIIFHENMELEAKRVAKSLKDVYDVPVKNSFQSLDGLLVPIPDFNGYSGKSLKKLKARLPEVEKKAALILTKRDLYWETNNQEEDWVWGCGEDGTSISLISVARLRGKDSKPSDKLKVPLSQYLSRLESIAIHEVGHDFLDQQAKHFVDTKGVNARTGYIEELGVHCPDNKCVMYQSIDIKSPPPEEYYMLFGNAKRYDGGLDDALKIMHPDWFCELCKRELKTPEKYLVE